jgi:hypothetical protein
MPGIVPFGDNPPLVANASPLAVWLQGRWHTLSATPVFEGIWYLLLAALVAFVALLRRRWPAFAVAASGLGIALPLVLAAPAAEFRYLLWLVASAFIAALLLARPPTRTAVPGRPPQG